MSKLDLDLQKAKKEKEDLAKELENEAQAIETRRKIYFIKSNSALASWLNLSIQTLASIPSFGLVVSSQAMS